MTGHELISIAIDGMAFVGSNTVAFGLASFWLFSFMYMDFAF